MYMRVLKHIIIFNPSIIMRVRKAKKPQERTPYGRSNRWNRLPPNESIDNYVGLILTGQRPIGAKLPSCTWSHYQGNPELFPSSPRGAIPSLPFAKPASASSIPSRSRADRLESALPIGLLLSYERRRYEVWLLNNETARAEGVLEG